MTASTLLQHATLGKPDHFGTYALPDVVVSKTANYTANAGEYVLCDTTTAGFTVTLPATPTAGQIVGIKKTSADANAVTISPNVDGGSITITTQNHSLFVEYDGAAWRARSGHYPKSTFAFLATANTFTKQQTIARTDAVTAFSVKSVAGNETFRVQSDGNLYLGSASDEPNVNLIGASGNVQWEFGLDNANVPTLSDFYVARPETWDVNGHPTTVSDWFYIRNGHSQSNPPRLGLGIIPQDASNGALPTVPGVLEVSAWNTANGNTFTNVVAKTIATQTGFAFAATIPSGNPVWSVAIDGTVKVYDASNNAQVTMSPSAGITCTHDIVSSTDVTSRNGANKVAIGNFGPASQPAVQVVDAGTTWYRSSSFQWRTPGYVTIDRNVALGGSGSDAEIPLLVKGHGATQSGDLQQWQTNAVTTFAVTAAGIPKWTAAGNQQTTVGAAGGASALPATPTKYLKVVDSAGTTLVIPAYAAA